MSDTAPDTGETTQTTQTTETTEPQVTDTASLEAEVAKWKDLARKHEERSKTNSAAAKELETLRQQSMTDQEKAVAQAKIEAKAEAFREVGGKLVAAEIRAAAAGRPLDVDALLEGLDASRFVGDDGEPDRSAIVKWIDRIAPVPEPQTNTRPGFPDLGQGVRTDPNSVALNGDPLLADLKAKVGAR